MPAATSPQRAAALAAGAQLTHKTARELVRLIRSKAVSPVEMLDAYLDAIETINPKINAIVTLAAEQARDAAKRAEAAVMKGEQLGLLHGLPIGVKDVTPTAGIRTTYASPLYKDHVPTEDAEAVRRLKAAGAIVLAKTNTPEFAAGANTNNALFGPTRNPWNLALSPAGSSGGSAAAVAARILPIAQGTDFGCSIRIPAAFCGIVGIRATPGLTPSHPLALPWDPGQVSGPLAQDAEDAALYLDASKGFSRISPISFEPPWTSALAELERDDIKGLRIAYISDIAGIGVEAEIDAICGAAAAALDRQGAKVEHIAFDAGEGRAAYQTWRGFWMVGQQYQRLAQIDQFGKNLRGNVEAGLKLNALDFAKAEHTRAQLFHRFRELFERFDLLLTPAAPVQPYPIEMNFPDRINGRTFDNYIDWIAVAYLITLMSLPAATAPAGLSKAKLPVGMQIVAPRFEEPLILRVARAIHRASGVGLPPIAAGI
ncbi:MAG: amidase [Hyphomicrobiales bacterium]|nr:amidase [Hyphomicrobiales bacterium]